MSKEEMIMEITNSVKNISNSSEIINNTIDEIIENNKKINEALEETRSLLNDLLG